MKIAKGRVHMCLPLDNFFQTINVHYLFEDAYHTWGLQPISIFTFFLDVTAKKIRGKA